MPALFTPKRQMILPNFHTTFTSSKMPKSQDPRLPVWVDLHRRILRMTRRHHRIISSPRCTLSTTPTSSNPAQIA